MVSHGVLHQNTETEISFTLTFENNISGFKNLPTTGIFRENNSGGKNFISPNLIVLHK